MPHPRTLARAWGAAAMLGVLAVYGLCAFLFCGAHHSVKPEVTAGDFEWSLRAARDLVAERDPYRYQPGPYAIPYPLPTAIVVLPLAWMPDLWAGSVFMGLSVMLLAFAILRSGQEWRLGMLLSWSFIYALLWVQWTPLLCALWFLPALAAIALIKPNMALPLLLAARIRQRVVAAPPLAMAASTSGFAHRQPALVSDMAVSLVPANLQLSRNFAAAVCAAAGSAGAALAASLARPQSLADRDPGADAAAHGLRSIADHASRRHPPSIMDSDPGLVDQLRDFPELEWLELRALRLAKLPVGDSLPARRGHAGVAQIKGFSSYRTQTIFRNRAGHKLSALQVLFVWPWRLDQEGFDDSNTQQDNEGCGD